MDCCKQLLIFILVSIADQVFSGGSWSTCSRSCGLGIMYRSIPCQNDGCDGTRKEYQACMVKHCIGGIDDFRNEQCKKFGEQSIPFVNKTDPCKLLCSSPGQQPVNHGLVVDGTSCPSSGICVDGECVPLGCDGILGSKKTVNKCGTCSDFCVQLPCNIEEVNYKGFIYTRSVSYQVQSDYHTELPAESRNISIALGIPSCDFKAINSSAKSYLVGSGLSEEISISGTIFTINNNHLTAVGPLQSPVTIKVNCPKHNIHCHYHMSLHPPPYLKIPLFYEWAQGENFSPCSQTCGRGIQTQEIFCRERHSHRRAPDVECRSDRRFPTFRFCDQPACTSEWMHSDWTQCSKSCGGGYRTRNVSCAQGYQDEVEPIQTIRECDNKTKPPSLDECNNHPCHSHWHSGDWSSCSVDCGEGTQSRKVTCRDVDGNTMYRHNCSMRAKPNIMRLCTGYLCVYKWIKSNWTKCSVSCGEGVHTRRVDCTKNGTIVDDSFCIKNIPDSKPIEERACQGPFCYGTWAVEKWSEKCVAPRCGEVGVKYRKVYCIYNGKTAKEYNYIKCEPAAKPSQSQTCYKIEGCNAEWHASDWSPCSGTCDGVQTRTLHCRVGNATVPYKMCPSHIKPSVAQRCSPNCIFSEECLREYCYRNNISPCQKHCCDKCEQLMPSLPSQPRYQFCDRPCCTGTLSWKNKGAC